MPAWLGNQRIIRERGTRTGGGPTTATLGPMNRRRGSRVPGSVLRPVISMMAIVLVALMASGLSACTRIAAEDIDPIAADTDSDPTASTRELGPPAKAEETGPITAPGAEARDPAGARAGDCPATIFDGEDLAFVGSRPAGNPDLRCADFAGLPIKVASFSGLDLSHADFGAARLEAVEFDGTVLTGASFAGAELIGVRFEEADLTGVDFGAATFIDVEFDDVEFTDVICPDHSTAHPTGCG